jgi:histidine triad (HIT) family protein
MSTIFSKIIRGEVPADIVYQDEIATVNDLGEEDEALAGHMLLTARRLAREAGVDESGYRLIINCNRDGGQEVDHLHLHLMGGRPMGPMVVRV